MIISKTIKSCKKKEDSAMKNWQYKMHAVVRDTIREQITKANKEEGFDPNVVNLYLQLEKMSKSLLANGEMQEGNSIRVPLEDGSIMEIAFYKDYSTVVMESLETGKRIDAVTKEDSCKQEYRFLEGQAFALENSHLGIGTHYPKAFEEAVLTAQPGDILHFDNNKAYVCTANQFGSVGFCRISNDNKTPYISQIKEYDTVGVIKGMPLETQKFYRQVHDLYTDDTKFKVTTITSARELLNKLLINKNDAKELVIGPNKFMVKPSKEGKGLIYYDHTGNLVPEDRMLYLLGWLKASPNNVEINRYANDTPQNQFKDTECKRHFEELMAKNNFAEAFIVLGGHLRENEDAVQVNMSSYVQNGLRFDAVSYLFECKNDELVIKKLSYKDNDFSKDVVKIENASMEEVLQYCKNKYDSAYRLIKSSIMTDIYKDYPNWNGEFLSKYIDNMAQKKMESLSIFDIDANAVDKSTIPFLHLDIEEETYYGLS